ncbi:MAG: hypothetical protein ACM3SS_24190 [Rhodospirillaceae bacterium]
MMRLWSGLVAVPVLFLAELTLAYALVPYACVSQKHIVLHIVQVITLLVAIVSALSALAAYRVAGAENPADAGDEAARQRFIALLGALVSGTIVLAMLAQWITTWVIPPCVR